MKNNDKTALGFSLIEMIIAITILLMIGLAVLSFQKEIFSFNALISSELVVQEEMRRAFKTMGEEIRSVSPSSAGAYPVSEATSTSFTFYVDIDDDGLKERVRYFLDGQTLKKGVLKPTTNPIVYNPANEIITGAINNVLPGSPIFEYYDSSYDGTTPPLAPPVNLSQIRLVKITVSVDENPLLPPAAITMTTQISMRNLKDNL